MIVGILGLGSIGSRHGRNLMTLGHQVIAHDPDQLSASREQVIKEADAVLICTPTKRHMPDFMDVVEANKHVFVEKPFAFDAPPEFLSAYMRGLRAVNKDLVVAVGYNLRFHHCIKRTKMLIESGFLGDVEEAVFTVKQFNAKPAYLRDGVIRNWASHEIDLARHLLGEMAMSQCVAVLDKGQDINAVIGMNPIESEIGTVSVHADYITKPEKRGFYIIGTRGLIETDLVRRTMAWGERDNLNAKRDNYLTMQDTYDENYVDEIKAFLDAIEGKDPGPLANAIDGIAAHQLVLEARKAAGLEEGYEKKIQV